MSKVIPFVMIIVFTLAACGNRTASMVDKTAIAPKEAAPQPASQPTSQPAPVATGEAPAITAKPPATAAKPPTTAAKPPAPKAVVVQPSRSLAGHDRFLVSQPLGGVRPADFELGPLMDKTIEPSITPIIESFAKAMADKNLEAAAFSSQGLVLAKLLYAPDLESAPAITKIRWSEPEHMPGSSYAVGLRLFSDLGYADGLVILGTGDDGNWLIEQLDLYLDGLDKPTTRSEPYDPYGYSRNLME